MIRPFITKYSDQRNLQLYLDRNFFLFSVLHLFLGFFIFQIYAWKWRERERNGCCIRWLTDEIGLVTVQKSDHITQVLPGLGVEHDPGGKTRTNCRDRALIYSPLITGPQNAFISDSLYDIFIIINSRGRHSLSIHTQPVGYNLNLWYLFLRFKI